MSLESERGAVKAPLLSKTDRVNALESAAWSARQFIKEHFPLNVLGKTEAGRIVDQIDAAILSIDLPSLTGTPSTPPR